MQSEAFEEQEFSKRKQCGRRYKGVQLIAKEIDVPEADLQRVCDEYLAIKKHYNVRIPDSFWSWWAKCSAPGWLKGLIKKALGGWPDTMIFLPLNDKYLIALPLELKRLSGKLHGKQVPMSYDLKYTIARTSEEIIKAIDDFELEASIIREKLKED